MNGSQPPTIPFERIVAEHRGIMEARARQLCRGNLDPDDLVQETLTRALQNYGSLRDASCTRAWLLLILNNTFVDTLRKRHSAPQQEPIEDHDPPAPSPEPAPEWDSITTQQFLDAVEKLPDDVRECYRMHALEGRDYNYIAAKLGIPKATVGTRLVRARKKLLGLLRPEKPEDQP